MEKNKQSARQAALENYAALVRRLTPKSQLGRGCLRAFWVGSVICMLGQAVADIGAAWLGLTSGAALTLGSVSLVFIAAILTGVGVFDQIAIRRCREHLCLLPALPTPWCPQPWNLSPRAG